MSVQSLSLSVQSPSSSQCVSLIVPCTSSVSFTSKYWYDQSVIENADTTKMIMINSIAHASSASPTMDPAAVAIMKQKAGTIEITKSLSAGWGTFTDNAKVAARTKLSRAITQANIEKKMERAPHMLFH